MMERDDLRMIKNVFQYSFRKESTLGWDDKD